MRRFICFAVMGMMFMYYGVAVAQTSSLFGDEPSLDMLGAPLYPGAEFVRTIEGLLPTYETAIYISLVPFTIVEDFFNRQLAEKRVITYEDEKIYLTAYLLRTWSEFPLKPTRDDLDDLSKEPSVQIQYYDPDDYEALAEFFDRSEEGKNTAAMIRNGKTMILYTYEMKEQTTNSQKVIGTWRESSRDLPAYYGTVLTFHEDGTYTYTATQENMTLLAAEPPFGAQFGDMTETERAETINARNPENGSYSVVGNSISMVSDAPVDGDERKSGLVEAGSVTLKLELIGRPRLTFIKSRDQK